MAQPTDAFDELSSRISERKRSDSGIHNIEDLNVEESRAEHHFTRRHSADELGDSGRESADQMDTSTSSNSKSKKKKAGNFFKGFKNIFRKKSKRKSQDGEGSLQEQYKSRSQDDIMVGGGSGGNTRNDDHLRRLNSDGSSLTSKRSKSPINQDDDNNSEKKNSLKDAQQYIRSSLRKLKSKKGDKNDLDTTVESMDSEPKLDTSSRARSTSSLGNSSFNDDFFSKTLAEESTDQFGNHSSAPVKLGDIKPTTPQIENTVAKDRIRVAPQNRRKPSRYRTGNAPPKPARSTSSFSFKEDSFLTKIDEDSDNFESRQTTNVSRHTSNVSRNSDWDSMPSYSRSNSEMTNRSSFDNTEPNFNDAVPKALRNKHSFSTADDFQPQKQRTMAQRSFSTNSRENVNRPKPPIKPPRSANSSIQSLDDNEDLPVKKFSLGELKSKLFYSESFGKNDDEKRLSRDQVFGSRASIDEKEKSAPEKRQSYGYERESPGDNQTSSPEKRQSFGDKRESFGEKRQSFGEKRQSFGEKRLSSVDTTPVEEKRLSKVSYGSRNSLTGKSFEIDEKRNSGSVTIQSYSVPGLSRSRTSLNRESPEKKPSPETTTIKNQEGFYRSKEDISQQRKSVHEEKELVFPKSQEGDSYGMLAMALTSPRQDRKIESSPPLSNISRSKSYSEKLENRENSSYSSTNSKSVGYINQTGAKSPPVVRQRPATSPRKLHRPDKEEEEKPFEFKRISLKSVPKAEDYMDSKESVEKANESHNTATTSSNDILDFVNSEMNLDEPVTNQPKSFSRTPNASTSSYQKVSSPVRKSEDIETNCMAFDSAKLSSIDLNTSSFNEKSFEEKPRHDVKRASWKTIDEKPKVVESLEFKRHSLKKIDRNSFEQHAPVEDSAGSPLEMKRHSLKKVDPPSLAGEAKSFSLPSNRDVKPEVEEQMDRPPRPLAKNRPTVHGSPSKDFSFQSSDVIQRSKSLGSKEQKRLGDAASSKENLASSPSNAEPEWFRLARQKQETDKDKNNGSTNEANSRPLSPPTKPKPKISPRPPIGQKPEVSPRPPIVAKKPVQTTVSPTRSGSRVQRNVETTTSNSSEPEWFKLARKKQKNEEVV